VRLSARVAHSTRVASLQSELERASDAEQALVVARQWTGVAGSNLFAGLDAFPAGAPAQYRKLWVAYYLRLHHLGQRPKPAVVDTATLLRLRVVLGVFALSRDAAKECSACHRPFDDHPSAADPAPRGLKAVRSRRRHTAPSAGSEAADGSAVPADSGIAAVFALVHHDVASVLAMSDPSAASRLGLWRSLLPGHAVSLVRASETTEWLLCVRREADGRAAQWSAFALVPGTRTRWLYRFDDPHACIPLLNASHFTSEARPVVAWTESSTHTSAREDVSHPMLVEAWAYGGAQPETILEAHDAVRTIIAAQRQQVWASEWLRAEEMQLLSALCGPTMTDDVSDVDDVAQRLWAAPHALPQHRYPLSRLLASRVAAPDWLSHFRVTCSAAGGVLDPLTQVDGSLAPDSDRFLHLQAVEHHGPLAPGWAAAEADAGGGGGVADADDDDSPAPPKQAVLEGSSAALWWLASPSPREGCAVSGPVVLAGYAGSGKTTALATWLVRNASDLSFSPFEAVVLLDTAPDDWAHCVSDEERKVALAWHVVATMALADGSNDELVTTVQRQLFAPTARVLWLLDHAQQRPSILAPSTERDSAGAGAGSLLPPRVDATTLAGDLSRLVAPSSVVVRTHTVSYVPRWHGDAPQGLLRACADVINAVGHPVTTRVLWLHGLTRSGALNYLQFLHGAAVPTGETSGHPSVPVGSGVALRTVAAGGAGPPRGAAGTPLRTAWSWLWGNRSDDAAPPEPAPAELWRLVERSQDLLALLRLPRSLSEHRHAVRKVLVDGHHVGPPRGAGTWSSQGEAAVVGAVLNEAPVSPAEKDSALLALGIGGPAAPRDERPARLLPALTELHAARALSDRFKCPFDAEACHLRSAHDQLRTNGTLVRLLCHATLHRVTCEHPTAKPQDVFSFLTAAFPVADFELSAAVPDDPAVEVCFEAQAGACDGMNGLSAFFASVPREVAKVAPSDWRLNLIHRANSAFAVVAPMSPVGQLGDPRALQIVAALWPSRSGSLVAELLRVVTDMASLRGGVQDLRLRTLALTAVGLDNPGVTETLLGLLNNAATSEEHLPALAECWLLRNPELAVSAALAAASNPSKCPLCLPAAAAVVQSMCRVVNTAFHEHISLRERTVLATALFRIAATAVPRVAGSTASAGAGKRRVVDLGAAARQGLVINTAEYPRVMPGASEHLRRFTTWLDGVGLALGYQDTAQGEKAAKGPGGK
jgi:hypothetical protein